MSESKEKAGETASRSDEEFEAMRKSIMAKKSIESVSDEDLPHFVEYMNKYKNQQLDEENYLEAKDAAAILEACKAEYAARQKKTSDAQSTESTSSDYADRKQKIEEKIQKFDQETSTKLQTIQDNHQKEEDEFETKWREEMPEKYRRIPKRLLELHETARTLALAGQYDEAQARKNEAVQLEQEEAKEAQHRLNRDYRQAKNKLLAKHRSEIQKFNETRQLKRDLLQAEITQLEYSEKNREIVLKSKPVTTKRSVRDSQSDNLSSSMRKPGPRKTMKRNEKKLPPLRPPNEKVEKKSPEKAPSQASTENPVVESPKKEVDPPTEEVVEEPKNESLSGMKNTITDALVGDEKEDVPEQSE